MTDLKRGYGGAAKGIDADLLGGLRAASRTRRARTAEAEATSPDRAAIPARTGARSFDFSTLPDYGQLKLQRAAADMLGIDNPFFRAHEERAGNETTIGSRRYLNFASYDYLGLNGHPAVVEAAKEAIDRYGTSVSASRLVAGERPIHAELEAALAAAHGTEAAVAMVSGHATNVTTIGTLLGPKDLILVDALIHNSVAEGARLSGATRLVFPHNDIDTLTRMLDRVRDQYNHVLIVVEGIYSMDGDYPDLARLIAVKRHYDCWLMVDEAHSFGVLGQTGRGIAEAQGIAPAEVELWMGTLSKTLSSCGGYIAGSADLIEYLKIKAPGFVYSVGLSAPLAAAALASLQVMADEPWRVSRLQENGVRFLAAARAAGLDTGLSTGNAVVPVIVGDSAKAAVLSDHVFREGLNALPIIYPAVQEQAARLRFFITSRHTAEQIDRAVAITADALSAIEAGGPVLRRLMRT